jgi:transcriptional regulator with PAS, ATPase and Fis domain
MKKPHQWVNEFQGAITVCDMDGTIIEMNERSKETFAKYGGADLIGKSLMDCHPPAAQEKIRELLASGKTNAYTIEKNGVKKLIYQTPWYKDGKRAGLVELSLEIPEEMPHFKRS